MRGDTRRAVAAIAVVLGCSSGDAGAADPAVARGKKVYQNVCIACHSPDPSQDGPLGPAIAGASRELLAAKVLRGEYPAGYQPKRPASLVMPQFPYLEDQIDDLTAYLGAVGSE